ncbi:GNAT family N-acetyltransferase [Oceanobacillus halophilus]
MIRNAVISDAEQLMRLTQQVERESPFMMYEANERQISADKQKRMIEDLTSVENSTIFVAEVDHGLVGYLLAIGGSSNKTKHSAYIVVGILQEFQGKGIGTALFNELDRWAKGKLHRLELTVITENSAGINLYQKAGFKKEGTKKHSIYMDGKYVDEYYMSKLLEG